MLLDQDHLMIRDAVRTFVRDAVTPNAAQWDRERTFPADVHRQLAELGAYGVLVPEASFLTGQVLLVDLLKREGGATLADIVEATGWLPHTSRAALTGLRKKGHEVARDSAHPRGQAVDFRIPEVPTKTLLRYVRSLKLGGVGYYPESRFVHCDVGPVRYWRGHVMTTMPTSSIGIATAPWRHRWASRGT